MSVGPGGPDPQIPLPWLADAEPGTLVYGFPSDEGHDPWLEVLVRESSALIRRTASADTLQVRAGQILERDIPVVAVLFALDPAAAVYASFWNYHHPPAPEGGHSFDHMISGHDRLHFQMIGDSGSTEHALAARHPLAPFFRKSVEAFRHLPAWSDEDFRRALASIRARFTPADLWRSFGAL